MTVMVEVPEGVTAGGGGATAALPPPQPTALRIAPKMTAARTPENVKRRAPLVLPDSRSPFRKRRRTSVNARKGSSGTLENGGGASGGESGVRADPLVVTVTVNGVAIPFARDTLAGT